MTTQSTLFDPVRPTDVNVHLLEPKARPRDPETASNLREYCALLFTKAGRHATNAQIQDWMERHPDEMEQDYPGYKRRCAALRRRALEPEYVAAKATLRKALGGEE